MSKKILLLFISILVISACTPEYKFPEITRTTPEINPDNDNDGDGRDDDDGDGDDNEPRIPSYGRYESCLAIHKAHSDFNNGYYYIDHDWDLDSAFVNVYCDMTNGGYTEILGTEGNINLDELQKMCNFNGPKKTLYSDKVKGLGWGVGKGSEKERSKSCMRCDLFSFMDLKVTLSAKAKYQDIINRSKGYLWIPNHRYRNGWKVIEFNDRFKKDSKGSNELYVNTVKEINRLPIIDITNKEVHAPYRSSGDLTVCMGGKKGFYYNKRFIKNLRVR